MKIIGSRGASPREPSCLLRAYLIAGMILPENFAVYDTPCETPIDPRDLRDCCGSFATGVTVVTTRTPEGDHGMTVNAFMSVSLDPPLICVSLGNASKMVAKIRKTRRFAVNILRHDMQRHALHFAGRRDELLTDMFMDHVGLPVLRNAAGILVCDLAQEIEAGDHILFLGRVTNLRRDPEAKPLLYHGGSFDKLSGFASQSQPA